MSAQRIIVIIGIALILLLGGTTIYFLTKSKKQEEIIEEKEKENIQLEEEIKQLDEKIKQLEIDLQDKNIELKEKDRRLSELEKELQAARAKINQLIQAGKLSQKQLEEYKFKVDQMQYYIEKYQAQIAQLKEENERLRQQTHSLQRELAAKDSVTMVLKEKEMLYETKLKAAAILKATNFQFYRIKSSGKEVAEEEIRARRLTQLKICFDILENPVAEPGPRTIYIVILDPAGNVYKNFETTSGYFTHNDAERIYSTSTRIQYDRTTTKACAVFDTGDKVTLEKGQNRVEVYCDGYLIGSSSFHVK